MKYSLHVRLAIAVCFAVLIFATSTRGSLEELLAPLPAPVASNPAVKEVRISNSFVERKERQRAVEEVIDGILSSDLQDSLEDALEWSLRPNGAVTLVPLRELPDLSAYAQPFQVTLINSPGQLSRNNMLIRFQVENRTGVIGEWTVPFRTHLYGEVWYVRSHLRAGETASASDLEMREVDLLLYPDAVPASLDALLRHEYRRDITPGQPLAWRDLTERSLVRKGEIIEVSAEQGMLSISMRAVSRQDGGEGDIILLRNIDSAKEFSARVVGEGRAEIVF